MVIGPLVAYLGIAAFLFRGSTGLGMEFDEVFRLNNLVPHMYRMADPYNQAISSLTVLGHDLPLMYKEYISSASLVPYLFLPLFGDPVIGLRVLYLAYTVGAAWLGYLLFRSRHPRIAFVVPGLALLSPLLYPDVTYGFVSVPHLIPLLIAVWAAGRYMRTAGPGWLVLAVFLAAVAVNVSFYAAFPLTGLVAAALLLYPRELWAFLRRPLWLLAAVVAAVLGLANYVYYNVSSGYPTLAPVLSRLGLTGDDASIDYRESSGLLAELGPRLSLLWGLLGGAAWWLSVMCLVALVVLGIAGVVSVRSGQLRRDRLLLIPAVAVPVTLMVILMSPNATRRGHYAMLTGLIEVLLVAGFVAIARSRSRERTSATRVVGAVLALALAIGYGVVDERAMDRVRLTGGTGFFSDAIFEVWEYLEVSEVPDSRVLQVQWGSYSQLYFLSHGTYASPVVVFDVLGASTEQERAHVVIDAAEDAGGTVVVPVYTDVPAVAGVDARGLLEDAAARGGGDVCTLEVFGDRTGAEQMRLVSLSIGTGGSGDPDLTEACSGPSS